MITFKTIHNNSRVVKYNSFSSKQVGKQIRIILLFLFNVQHLNYRRFRET